MNKLFIKIKAVVLFLAVTIIVYTGVCYSTDQKPTYISHYSFGEIIINDISYKHDIAIWPDGTITPGPEDMHFMSVNDFDELFKSDLRKLVIGTGDEAKVEMDISRKLERALKSKDIELILMDTHELVKFLNDTPERNFLVFAHLNC